MATWRIDLAYDGSAFRGWARQPGLATVQGELEAALATLLREPVALTVAGRTDSGVHARGQVASFTAPEPSELGSEAGRIARGLDALTAPEIAIIACKPTREGFDARRDALSRTYRYRVETGSPRSPFERGRAWWWPHGLDRELLDRCAALLAGSHDFTAFTPTRTEHVRFRRQVLSAAWRQEGDGSSGLPPVLAFAIEADAFMRNMVRILVGTMVEIAAGRRSLADFEALLAGAPRSAAGRTAPAEGLCLESVRYGGP